MTSPQDSSTSTSSMLKDSSSNTKIEDDVCTFSIYTKLNQSETIAWELKQFWTSRNHFHYDPSKDRFIWHNGQPPSITESTDRSSLQGNLNYGDSIQDEWFLVWCLYQISTQFECEICVNDTDGEFLLIEAAEHLPKWVTPDLAYGRVWIRSGSLHLIPLEAAPKFRSEKLPIPVALKVLRQGTHDTSTSQTLDSAVKDRVMCASPEQLTQNHLFNTVAYLRQDVSKALHNDPDLIGLAVKAFCDKDPDVFKACQSMKRLPPSMIPEQDPRDQQLRTSSDSTNIVLSPLKMTRPLYAMIFNSQVNFYPPKPFEKVGWMSCDIDNIAEWKKRSLGMKILCGFEMMLFESDLTASLKTNFNPNSKKYKVYLNKLNKCDFFQGELEGSQKWKGLESIARSTYIESMNHSNLSERFCKVSDLSSDGSQCTSVSTPPLAETDEWLELDDEKLKQYFKDYDHNSNPTASVMPDVEEEALAKTDVEKMTSFADRIEKFVDGKGSLEGALHSDDEESEEDSDTDSEDSEQAALREDIFPTGDKNKAKLSPRWARGTGTRDHDDKAKKRLETLVPGLAANEWGQKPTPTTDSHDDHSKSSNQIFKTTPKASLAKKSDLVTTVESTPKPKINKKIISRLAPQTYDGVCDDSSDEEMDIDIDVQEGQHSQAEIVEEVDMDEERDEFLNFAREALGLTAEQYESILNSRMERGAYVPPKPQVKTTTNTSDDDDDEDMDIPEFTPSSPVENGKSKKQVHFSTIPSSLTSTSVIRSNSCKIKSGNRNENFDAFDTLMNQMDSELQRQTKKISQQSKKGGPIEITNKLNGPDLIGDQVDNDSENSENYSDLNQIEGLEQIDEAMKTELKELMLKSNVDFDCDLNPEIDYGMISNFLESFKSQIGLPGPVGNMAGRIGIDLLGKDDQNKTKN